MNTGLRAALDARLSQSRSARIVSLDMHPLAYASSFAIEAADVWFDDGSVLELVCKATDEGAMLPEARRIKPRFLHNPLREIATYERILAPLAIGAPRFYGSAIDSRSGRHWLFLERVRGVPLTEVGDFSVWLSVSAWLAAMHARLARDRRAANATLAVPLVRYNRTQSRSWMARALRHVDADTAQPRPRRDGFLALAAAYESVLDEIAAQPAGVVHGEFFASNVLVEIATGQVRVRPIDWEVAGVGPPLMDLAALIAGRWTESQRAELAGAYRCVAAAEHQSSLSLEQFTRALDCCRLQLAVQRLGWARRWTPPAEHAQDWLGDALQTADRLGLRS